MPTLPPGEAGLPQSEGQDATEIKTLTPEDLKKRRVALEARVAEVKKQREENVQKQLSDREAMIAEDGRAVPLLAEARGTLDYFETQNNLGVLTQPKDIKELASLRELVTSLEQQRAETLGKYDAITSQPEIYDEVWKAAHQEKDSRDFVENYTKAQTELEKKADGFFERMERLTQRKVAAYNDVTEAEEEYRP